MTRNTGTCRQLSGKDPSPPLEPTFRSLRRISDKPQEPGDSWIESTAMGQSSFGFDDSGLASEHNLRGEGPDRSHVGIYGEDWHLQLGSHRDVHVL